MRSKLFAGLGVVAMTTAALAVTTPAMAATSSDLAAAILADPSVLVGSELVLDPSGGQSTMVASTPVAGFPTEGDTYAILSSGRAADLFLPNSEGNRSTDFGGASRHGGSDHDVTVLRIDINVPDDANCLLGVDFRFLSEEFPEYVGDNYNDAFIAEVDSTTWTSNGNTIDAPGNFAFDKAGNPISINGAGAATMTADEAAGTTFDGASSLLTAATPLTPGPHSLFFSIFDQGDGVYDSAVMIDNLRIGRVSDVATQCVAGAQAAGPRATPDVTFHDVYGSADDSYTLAAATGLSYEVNGAPAAPGTYPGTGTVTVTAVPDDGYLINGPATFTHTFDTSEATDQTSTGSGSAAQTVTLPMPVGGTPALLDGDGRPVTTVTAPGEGTYTLDPATGVVTFVPDEGFSGAATGVTYEIQDTHGGTSQATYRPSVTLPAAPVADPLTSSGPAGTAQSSPAVAAHRLTLDDGGDPASTVAIPGEGTYTVRHDGTWTITFTPEGCWTGTATPVGYEVSDAYGQHDASTYTPTVLAPASAPSAPSLTSAGVGDAEQRVSVPVLSCGSTSLLDDEAHEVTSLTRPGEGTYALDRTAGTITFAPAFGYSGTPAAVGIRLDDGFGHVVDGTYIPTVTAPAPPTATDRTSTGAGTTPQTAHLPLPSGGTVTLLDGHGDPAMTVTVAHGTYVLDPVTGVVSFVPVRGFAGAPEPIGYQVTDAYGQTATGTYRPSVTVPLPPPSGVPAAGPTTSKGAPGAPQQVQVTVPAGGSIVLLDPDGHAVTELVVPGVGTFSVAPTGVLTFTPAAGYTGTGASVRYRIADVYGQTSVGTYAVTVAATQTKSGDARVTAPALVRHARTVPATCRLTSGRLASCAVSAYAVVRGERVLVGKGSAKAGAGGATSITVQIALNGLGRALAAQPHGASLSLLADVRQAALDGHRFATASSRVVAPTVRLRPVYFATDSARLRSVDRAYLRSVSAQLGGVRSITCTGYADARATTPYNARLGLVRAKALCAALVGDRQIRVTVISRGERRPAYTNATSEGRALNRRGEVTLKY